MSPTSSSSRSRSSSSSSSRSSSSRRSSSCSRSRGSSSSDPQLSSETSESLVFIVLLCKGGVQSLLFRKHYGIVRQAHSASLLDEYR